MPPRLLAPLAAAAVVVAIAAGCSSTPLPGVDRSSEAGSGPPPGPDGLPVLARGTCWTGTTVGADPQDVLKLSASTGVPYLAAARAVADRPAFSRSTSCSDDHAVEVFEVVRLPKLEAKIADYAALLRVESPLFATISHSVAEACMTKNLVKAAARTGLPGAVMAPALPTGAEVGWAPAAPAQWAAGQRVFACTLTWAHPQSVRYESVFTKGFPISQRTCIDTKSLAFVDCARRHDGERIAFIEARDAVAAGAFPGPKAVRKGPDGRYLDVPDAGWRRLDAACTSYLRSISATKKLTGVANVDVDQWPRPDGSFPIWCDADTPPDQHSLVTQGSVYDR